MQKQRGLLIDTVWEGLSRGKQWEGIPGMHGGLYGKEGDTIWKYLSVWQAVGYMKDGS
jgi:hypothetical protein